MHDGRLLTSVTHDIIYKYMKIQIRGNRTMAAVKIGASRQVVIPKKIHDQLGLAHGDYLEVELERGKVVMTPKALVEKRFKIELEKRLAEGLEDIRRGQVYGPFNSAKELIADLHRRTKKRTSAGKNKT